MIPFNKYKTIAYFTLSASIIITLFMGYCASKLQFNHNFEDYFPKNDVDATHYENFRKTFGSENNFLAIAIEDEHIFNQKFNERLTKFCDELKNTNDVTKVTSPNSVKEVILGKYAAIEVPLLHPTSNEALANDSIKIYDSKEWNGSLFGTNKKSVLVVVEYKPNLFGLEAKALLHNIDSLLALNGFEKNYQAGRVKAEYVFITKMQEELSLFISLSIILLIVFLWIAYKSLWGVLMPLSAVLMSIIWTCGIMQLTGYKLDILTVLLPSILFIITISDITHFLSKYIEELRFGKSKNEAFTLAYKEIGIATFITALTTAVGFVTFLNAQMQPIKFFGVYAAAGVFVSYIIAFTYMPAIIILLPKPKVSTIDTNDHFWHKKLHNLLLWVFRNNKKVIWGCVLVCLVSGILMLNIKINGTIIDDISDKDQLKKSLFYIEDNFGGVRNFELDISLSKNNGSVFTKASFEEISKIHDYLTKEYEVNNLISPKTMICAINKSKNGGQNSFFSVPSDDTLLTQLNLLKKQQNRKELRSFIKDGGYRIRFSGKVKDLGSMVFKKKNEKLYTLLDPMTKDGSLAEYHITGSATLVDKNNLQIAYDMILDLFIGVLTIGVIVGFLFKSFKMAALAIIPNFAPLMLIAGIMGICGMNLKASNSIIFSIAFGIAIDDSIHFLSRLKEELHRGRNLPMAIKTTYLSTGKAMLITSLIVISGFCTMVFSDFGGTFYMGLLVSLTLVFAIAFDFLLMPALLVNFFEKKKKSNQTDL
jgi:uncharacterized protein